MFGYRRSKTRMDKACGRIVPPSVNILFASEASKETTSNPVVCCLWFILSVVLSDLKTPSAPANSILSLLVNEPFMFGLNPYQDKYRN